MGCLNDERLLEQYLDGELADAHVHRVESALETCAHCRAFVESAETVRGALREVHARALEAAPVDAMWSRIEASLPAAAPAPEGALQKLARWYRGALATRRLELVLGTAAAIAAVAAGVWIVRSLPERAAPGERPMAESAPADNTFVVESYEVSEGTVVIDQDPDDASAPAVVWHFVEGEQGGG